MVVCCSAVKTRYQNFTYKQKVLFNFAIFIILALAITLAVIQTRGSLSKGIKEKITLTSLSFSLLFLGYVAYILKNSARGEITHEDPPIPPVEPPSPPQPPRPVKVHLTPSFLSTLPDVLLTTLTSYLTSSDQVVLSCVNGLEDRKNRFFFFPMFEKMRLFYPNMIGGAGHLLHVDTWDRITHSSTVNVLECPADWDESHWPFGGREQHWPSLPFCDYSDFKEILDHHKISIFVGYDLQKRATIILNTPTDPIILYQKRAERNSPWIVVSALHNFVKTISLENEFGYQYPNPACPERIRYVTLKTVIGSKMPSDPKEWDNFLLNNNLREVKSHLGKKHLTRGPVTEQVYSGPSWQRGNMDYDDE